MFEDRIATGIPPRPPRPRDPVERPDPEALIEEARQRARRRRRIYAATAAALVLLGVSLAVVFDGPETSQSAASEQPALQVPPDDDAATIVAQYSKFHVGWVLVYGDGRVLTEGVCCAGDLPAERRLTVDGLDRVRSGAIRPSAFLSDHAIPLPAGTWADAERKPYEPSRYAVCPSLVTTPGARSRFRDPMRVGDRLPAPAHALLRGKERTYNIDRFLTPPGGSIEECFELSTEDASILAGTLIKAGLPSIAPNAASHVDCVSDEYETICPGVVASGDHPLFIIVPVHGVGEPVELVMMDVRPLLPHGEYVSWGA